MAESPAERMCAFQEKQGNAENWKTQNKTQNMKYDKRVRQRCKIATWNIDKRHIRIYMH
jgi:hypothetical protein